MSKTKQEPDLLPIEISAEAQRALTKKVQEWTGWRDATLRLGVPTRSPFADCDHETRTITANPERLILNPNRVLLTVTPFRLRQEAVLTGSLLHEAGHARHTHWKPRTLAEFEQTPVPLHSDGTPATDQVMSLAKLMEEPRIEGLMAAQADSIGAPDLEWTLRASAAYLIPPTDLSDIPAQAIMDLITSWALRAGRQIAVSSALFSTSKRYYAPRWVNEFTSLLGQAIEAHLTQREEAGAVLGETPNYRALQIIAGLNSMIECTDDTGPTMIDTARDILSMLFPETEDDTDENDGEAMAGGCSLEGQDQDNQDDPDDQGQGDQGDGDSDSEDNQDQGDDGENGDGSDDDRDQDSQGGATDSTDPASVLADLASMLADLENRSAEQTEEEAEEKADEDVPPDSGTAAGEGFSDWGSGWRRPTAEERETQKEAERFLRDLIDVSETSKRTVTDQPSAVVDGAALSAWKAGGQVRDPHFFVRTQRSVQPSPPIEIAVLVDVSSSMEVLQEPSALLSWALSAAALDLRNFAGRGQQVTSCLIHWGSRVKVIQKPGQAMPGIRNVSCNQGTSVMHEALAAIETEIPGFFDPARNVNRLLVQFTDWELLNVGLARKAVGRALEAGVNMLSVVPSKYSPRSSALPDIIKSCTIQRGGNALIKYDPTSPGTVWAQAAEMLATASRGGMPAPFPGF